MVNCCVPNCREKKVRGCGVSFHHFPVDSELIAEWVQAIFRHSGKSNPHWILTKNSVVCSKHFKETDYSISTSRRILLPRSVPSVFTKYPRKSSILGETQNVEEEKKENYNEIPSEKKRHRMRKVLLETSTIQEELENELTEDSSVNDETEVMAEQQSEYIPFDEDTGEQYETEELLEKATESTLLCRLCASASEDIVSLFENDQSDYILEKIHTYLPIMITAEDLLPTTVCGECVNKLEVCHSLIQGCLDADAMLKTMLGLNSNQMYCDAETEDIIKCEEYDDTDYFSMHNTEDLNDDQNNYIHSASAMSPAIKTQHSFVDKSIINRKPKLKKQTWKGKIKPKFKVVIVKIKNLTNTTNKVELQKTVQLAIHEKMKQQNPASGNRNVLPEMSSVTNSAKVSSLKDREQNHGKITLDHTYTLKICCQHCQQTFINKEEFLLHQQTSKQCDDNTFQCNNCNSLYESKQVLDEHSEVCYNNINGPKDEENHKNKSDTENNYERELKQGKLEDISSNNCKEDVVQKNVEVEVLDVDFKTNEKSGTVRFDSGCHIKFPKGFEHINTTHQAKILTAINKFIEKKLPKPETNETERIKGPDGWKCRMCYETLPTARAYRLHRQTHTPRPFPCTHCSRMFTSERNLKQHLAFHSTEKIYMCEFCGKVFKLRDSLKLHYFSHGKSEKIHKCNECGKTFGSKYRYNQHLLRHGKATYLCDICGKSMKYPGSLRCHKSLHKQKILYECTTCGKIYNSRQGLKTHTQIHVGELSFACDKCGKHFETQLNLSEHKLIHANTISYKCHICGKCFNLRPQLKKHVAKHQITLKYTCKLCQVTFSSMKELLVHRRSHLSVEIVNYLAEEQPVSESIL